jgi:hypothetical protein
MLGEQQHDSGPKRCCSTMRTPTGPEDRLIRTPRRVRESNVGYEVICVDGQTVGSENRHSGDAAEIPRHRRKDLGYRSTGRRIRHQQYVDLGP